MKPRKPIKAENAGITADYIRVVCQTLPDFPNLRPDVASLLAENTEFYIRSLVHLSKKHMRHSNAFHLSLQHVLLAHNFVSRQQPSFGFPASLEAPLFQSVKSCPGLYVYADSIVSLDQILHQPLPPPTASLQICQSTLVVPARSFTVSNKIPAQALTDPIVKAVVSILSSNINNPPHLESTLLTLNSTAAPLQTILTLLRDAVITHAQPDGHTQTLHNAMRITMALVSRSSYGVDIFEDTVLSMVLTCLLAQNLGHGNVHSLRILAAQVLHTFLFNVADHYVRQRVCNTLDSALIDAQSTLGSVYGAIIGLAVLGRHVFQPIFMPHLPNLTEKLNNALRMSRLAPPDIAHPIQRDIVFLSNAVESAMNQCQLFSTYTQLLDVVL